MTQVIEVPAIKGRVEVLIDTWGIPHIYASRDEDLYVAQGYVSAMFRLWQMDLWRKRGLGLLAASHGAAFVDADRARRLFLYRGDMRREWSAYGPGVQDRVEAFVAGINAYVERVTQQPVELPPEFRWTGDMPTLWKAADIVRIRSVGLRANVADEAARAQLAAIGALDEDHVRRRMRPPVELRWPHALDPADVPPEAMALYTLALAENPFATSDKARGAVVDTLSAASNVWAIGAGRTTTGRPILANDPHRAHGVPSVRWLVHLESPSVSAIGATEPVHPGIASGHNGHIGFGFTYSACDQEDLIVYRCKDDRYFRGSQACEFRSFEERIDIKGAPATTVKLKFTNDGPILHEDASRDTCIAIRSAFLEPGGAPYFAGVAYHQTKSIAEFEASLDRAVAPTMNYCAAETSGAVGIFVRGAVPRRASGCGNVPTLAGAQSLWDGFYAPADLPTWVESPKGWVANCNQVPRGSRIPVERLGSYSDDARFRRLEALINARQRVSLDDCARFQFDQVLEFAVSLTRRLLAADASLPEELRRVLAAWRGEMTVESAAGAFFAVWLEKHLKDALAAHLGPQAWPLFRQADIVDALPACSDVLLVKTAHAAARELIGRIGSDVTAWSLGQLQSVTLRHPLGRWSAEARGFDIGPLPLGGNVSTLNKAASSDTLQVEFGPSFRVLIDVGQWENSRAINMPGQSGDPTSPHWSDLLDHWLQGRYVPLLWARKDVDAATETRFCLVPPAAAAGSPKCA